MNTLALRTDARAPIISPETAEASPQLPTCHIFAGLKAGHYRCALVDAPTAFLAGTKGRPQHYTRMSDREIAALPVADLLHPDGAWIFLWVTSPQIPCVFAVRTVAVAGRDCSALGRSIFRAGFRLGQDQKVDGKRAAIRDDGRQPARRHGLRHTQERGGLLSFQGWQSQAPCARCPRDHPRTGSGALPQA